MEEVVIEGKISIATFIIRIIIDVLLMMILIGFILLIRDIIIYATTRLELTTKRVKGKTGLINTNELNSPLNKINGVQVKQRLFGKIFNYGEISITTASTTFVYKFIDQPNYFKETLLNQIELFDDERIEKQAKKIAEAMHEKKDV